MPATLPKTSRLHPKAAAAIRAAIHLAGGNEVCFACGLDDEGMIETARVVSRGDVMSVLALPGFAERGEMLVHNHPSGVLDKLIDLDQQHAGPFFLQHVFKFIHEIVPVQHALDGDIPRGLGDFSNGTTLEMVGWFPVDP